MITNAEYASDYRLMLSMIFKEKEKHTKFFGLVKNEDAEKEGLAKLRESVVTLMDMGCNGGKYVEQLFNQIISDMKAIGVNNSKELEEWYVKNQEKRNET